jgi:outer membrane protein TolC
LLKHKNLFCLWFGIFSTLLATQEFTAYEFETLVAKALKESPEIKVAHNSVQEKERAVMVQRAQYLPNLTLSASSLFDDRSRGGHTTHIGVQATQTIFNPTTIVKNQVASRQQSISQVNLELEKTRIQANTQTALLKAWLEQQREALMQLLLATASSEFARATKKAELGLLNRLQTLVAQSSLQNDAKTVAQYKDRLNNAFAELERAVGSNFEKGTDEALPKLKFVAPAFTPPGKAECMALALQNRKEMQLAAEKIELETEGRKLALAGYLPTVSATASTSGINDGLIITRHGKAGLLASWNFFDGAGHKFEAEVAEARSLRAENELELTKIKISTEVAVAFANAEVKQKELDWKTVKLREEHQTLTQKTARQQAGLFTQVELQKAQLEWTQAQFSWLEAKIALHLAQIELKMRCGFPTVWN